MANLVKKMSLLVIVFGLSACSMVAKEKLKNLEKKVAQLNEANRAQKKQISELINEKQHWNSLQKNKTNSCSPEEQASEQVSEFLMSLSEKSVYAKAIEAFRQRSPSILARATRILLKTYPESVHLDNAIFLNAKLAFLQEQWEEVKEWSYELEKKFPFSNKLAAVLVLSGLAHLQLGENAEANRRFLNIYQQFPGSYEAEKIKKFVVNSSLGRT